MREGGREGKEGGYCRLEKYTLIKDILNKGHLLKDTFLGPKCSLFYNIIASIFLTPKEGQPLYVGQNGWSQKCPLF